MLVNPMGQANACNEVWAHPKQLLLEDIAQMSLGQQPDSKATMWASKVRVMTGSFWWDIAYIYLGHETENTPKVRV